MVMISKEEIGSLFNLYTMVMTDLTKLIGVKIEGGHVEIYDIYLRGEDDVGIALYYESMVYDGDKPLTDYVTYTDARIDTERFVFQNYG